MCERVCVCLLSSATHWSATTTRAAWWTASRPPVTTTDEPRPRRRPLSRPNTRRRCTSRWGERWPWQRWTWSRVTRGRGWFCPNTAAWWTCAPPSSNTWGTARASPPTTARTRPEPAARPNPNPRKSTITASRYLYVPWMWPKMLTWH